MPRKSRPMEVGSSPMTILAPSDASPTQIRTHRYTAGQHQVLDGFHEAAEEALRWVDIQGLADTSAISQVARSLGLSDLAIADLFHLGQRPHAEVADQQVIMVLQMPDPEADDGFDQMTLVLGEHFVLTVRESEKDCLDMVRRRLSSGKGRIRSGSGYLFYALMDAVIDAFFPALEQYGDAAEDLEEQILDVPQDRSTVREIHRIKRDLIGFRHAIWPLREAIGAMLRDDTLLIDESLLPFFRDCADHAFQLLDMVEVYREVAQGLVDLQLSSLSNRMNEIMKVLTMISTVFIPMTFIAGVYGMNFNTESPWNLPELGWHFGYPYALALMAGSAIAVLMIFRRKGWILGGRERSKPQATGRRLSQK